MTTAATSPSTMLPEGYELRGAHDDEVLAAVTFAESVFVTPREFFYVRYRLYPGARAEHSRLVLHDGKIVSHQRIYPHDLQFAGSTVKAWAIGDVCTAPEHRRKHLGNALLEDCVAYAGARQAALVLIRASLFAFYGTCGWDKLPLPAIRLDTAEVPPDALSPQGYVTRAYEEQQDLWPVAAVHEQYNAGRSLVRVRDGQFWEQHRVWCPLERGLGFIVAEKQGSIVAYGRAWDGHLVELCHLPGEEAGVLAVLGAMVRQAKAAHLPSISGAVPADSPALRLTQGISGIERGTDEYTLVRIVNLRALFEQTIASLSNRLSAAGVSLSSPLTVRCQGQSVTLAPERGYLRLTDGTANGRVVDLTQRQLLEFGAGLTLPSASLQGAVDATTLAELDALFPQGNPIYWVSDNV
ncbi:MAG: GNAT family N-acetyltransferase [Anaerolineae bacterium]